MRPGIPINEASFGIEPYEGAHLKWTIAIRDLTPTDTIMVSPPLPLPVSVFAQRASYVAIDGDRDRRAGYSISVSDLLIGANAYPPEIVARRDRIVRQAYAEDSVPDFGELTKELTALHRPVALYLPHSNRYLAWLRKQQRGREIYQDAGG